jgi:L-ascorbate metabolism protein UlaG (beta-lactamase superfamily)
MRKEMVMSITVLWLGHASFKLSSGGNIVYIDPWKIKESPHDATVVLVSHSHPDHYSAPDIARISGPKTTVVAPADVAAGRKEYKSLSPGGQVTVSGIIITGVAAYNPQKQFHPKSNGWLGFIIQMESKRVYYAGDTDITDQMKEIRDIDLALLPVGGTYTMNPAEAAEATRFMKSKTAIPCHWGDIVGSRSDAEKFAKAADCDVQILSPGQTFVLE